MLREGDRLLEILKAQLDRDFLSPRAHPDLLAERGLETIRRLVQGGPLLGARGPLRPHGFWLAGQLNPLLGLPHRPAPLCRLSRQAATGVVPGNGKQSAAVALA